VHISERLQSVQTEIPQTIEMTTVFPANDGIFFGKNVFTEMSLGDYQKLTDQFAERGIFITEKGNSHTIDWKDKEADLDTLAELIRTIMYCFASDDEVFYGNVRCKYEELGKLVSSILMSNLGSTSSLKEGNSKSPLEHKFEQIESMRKLLLGKIPMDEEVRKLATKNITPKDLELLVYFSFAHDFGKVIGASEKNHSIASGMLAYELFAALNIHTTPKISNKVKKIFNPGQDFQMLPEKYSNVLGCIPTENREAFSREEIEFFSFLCARHHIFEGLLEFFDYQTLKQLKKMVPTKEQGLSWEEIEQQKKIFLQQQKAEGVTLLRVEDAKQKYPFLRNKRIVTLLYMFTVGDIHPQASYRCAYSPQNEEMYKLLMTT